jgi:hypothetical protein
MPGIPDLGHGIRIVTAWLQPQASHAAMGQARPALARERRLCPDRRDMPRLNASDRREPPRNP